MIEANALTKVFKDPKRGELKAVDSLSLRCESGSIYGLLGMNGAGKTTTLRLLATLLKPSSGSARVAGHDVEREGQAVRAQVGFLAASTALYGRLTARETLAYFGRLNGMAEERIVERTRSLSVQLGLEEFLDRRVERFSTGMKQRLSIARTVLHDPAVLILDEPTLGLDVLSSRNIVRFVRECRERGRTVIYSTHVMAEVEKLCDRVGIIHAGRLVGEGTLPELREKHACTDLEEIFLKAAGIQDGGLLS